MRTLTLLLVCVLCAAPQVQDLLGVPVHFYVKLGPESFARFIDAIGGIELDVEKDMKYTDRWAGLFIDLKKGRQHLNGRQAMGYVRFRHDALADTAGLNAEVFDALVVLAAGAWNPTAIASGYAAVETLQREMDDGRQRRLVRLGFVPADAAALSALHTRNFM